MGSLKNYRFIENEALYQAIKAKQAQKMKEENLENGFFCGKSLNFEIDEENLEIVNTISGIFSDHLTYDANIIVPIYIPGVQNINEIMDDLLTDKTFKYKLLEPIIETKLIKQKGGIDRFRRTDKLIRFINECVKTNENDCIYNVTTPKGFTIGNYIIHETNENGKIFKSLIDITNIYHPKLIKTNRPSMLNRIFGALGLSFHKKHKNGHLYNKL